MYTGVVLECQCGIMTLPGESNRAFQHRSGFQAWFRGLGAVADPGPE